MLLGPVLGPAAHPTVFSPEPGENLGVAKPFPTFVCELSGV